MFWLKTLFAYPLMALVFYVTSGKTLASLILCIGMLTLIKLSNFLISEITNA